MNLRRSVFKDETKLDINYLPSRLPHREKEHRLLMEFFAFMTRFPERMAQRVIVTGEIGTGKTALCKRFGADITTEAHKRGVNLLYVHVNCREYKGRLSMIIQHAVSMLHPNFPERGFSSEEIIRTLLQILDEEKAFMLLALDEFDSLIESEGSDAVYALIRLQEMRPDLPQRISLICIMRNLKATEKLDPSAKSTLQRNIISLEKYEKQQLVDILNERVSMAFEPSTVQEDVVSLAADLGVNESGNARFAIELLWRAGKYADAEDLEVVLPECVRRAVSSIVPIVQKSELQNLGISEKLFLLAVAEVFKSSEKAYVKLADIEKVYAVACEEFDAKPVSHTMLWKYVQRFSALGMLKSVVSGAEERGRSTLISLPSVPANELEKELRMLLEKGE